MGDPAQARKTRLFRARSGLVLGAAFALLLTGWAFSSRPFEAPDEAAHYLRALTITQGRLTGAPPTARTGGLADTAAPGRAGLQARWVAHDLRLVHVPKGFSPAGLHCLDGRPAPGQGGCTEETYTGDYNPLAYLLPAGALAISSGVGDGLWLARLASALQCLVLLAIAVAFTRDRSGWATLGLLLAATPQVVFIASVINPTGLEMAASIAFAAGLLRLAREPQRFPRWGWAALALSGGALILAWQLGLGFAAIELAVAGLLIGRRRLAGIARTHRRAPAGVGLVLVLAAALFVAYGAANGSLHSSFRPTPIAGSLHAGLNQLGPMLRGAVGNFGPLTVPLPTSLYVLWGLLVAGLLGVALWLAARRERVLLIAVTLLAVGFPLLFFAWSYRLSGFGLQGRYALPVLVLVPMLAGHLIDRSAAALRARGVRRGAVLGVCVVGPAQVVAWVVNARSASGAHTWLGFLHSAAWSPPGGWLPWALSVVVGGAAMLASGLRRDRPAVG